jgi:DNA-binding beta-propeller fold protein YncE
VSGVAYDPTTDRIYLIKGSRIDVVTMVKPADETTWTIGVLAGGPAGFANGDAASARFQTPAGLFLDPIAKVLYVADTGNHAVRAINLATMQVSTVAGTPTERGYFGDGGHATDALLFAPEAITSCPGGELFIADTGNHRIRRIDATGTITTVLGDGTAASSGEGEPAREFPIDSPRGLACDAIGNLYATSTTTVRQLPANDSHVVDGAGPVLTIYGAPPRETFPSSVTRCLTGIAIVDASTLHVADSCAGLLLELRRELR